MVAGFNSHKLVQAICSGGGDVLNVGFGLGLVDRAIQSNQPTSHTIIEAHPDVLRKVYFWDIPPKAINPEVRFSWIGLQRYQLQFS